MVWSEEHSAEMKLNPTEELQPMSNKIIVQDPAGESDGREIDKDDLLAWYDRNIENKKCLPPETQHVREVIRLAEKSPRIKGSAICLPDGSDKFFIGTELESLAKNMIRVNLPYTKRNQYWYTVNVNKSQPRVVCQEAKVALDNNLLKKLATMSKELGLMAKIPIIKNNEDSQLGAYAHPQLSPQVMIGPFGRKHEGEKQQHVAEPTQQYPPNWVGTRGSFIKEPIIYEDMTGKLVYITPRLNKSNDTPEIKVPPRPTETFTKFAKDTENQNNEESEATIQGATDELQQPWRDILADSEHIAQQLPDGVSVFNITQPENKQPLRVILPSIEQN